MPPKLSLSCTVIVCLPGQFLNSNWKAVKIALDHPPCKLIAFHHPVRGRPVLLRLDIQRCVALGARKMVLCVLIVMRFRASWAEHNILVLGQPYHQPGSINEKSCSERVVRRCHQRGPLLNGFPSENFSKQGASGAQPALGVHMDAPLSKSISNTGEVSRTTCWVEIQCRRVPIAGICVVGPVIPSPP